MNLPKYKKMWVWCAMLPKKGHLAPGDAVLKSRMSEACQITNSSTLCWGLWNSWVHSDMKCSIRSLNKTCTKMCGGAENFQNKCMGKKEIHDPSNRFPHFINKSNEFHSEWISWNLYILSSAVGDLYIGANIGPIYPNK